MLIENVLSKLLTSPQKMNQKLYRFKNKYFDTKSHWVLSPSEIPFKSNSWQHWVLIVKLGIFSNTSNILNLWCLHFISFRIVPISLDTEEYRAWEQKAQLAATLIEETQSIGHQKLIESTLRHLLSQNTIVQEVYYNTTNTLKHSKIY